TNTATPVSTTAIPAANASVSRALSDVCGRRILTESVPHSPHGLERRPAQPSVDLRTQATDVDVDDVRVALIRVVPHVLDQATARQRLAVMAHEVLEQCELLRRQVEERRSAPRGVRGRVELDTAHDEPGRT